MFILRRFKVSPTPAANWFIDLLEDDFRSICLKTITNYYNNRACYQLQLTIWNTKDAILDEGSIISGGKMSDIYIKGWIQDAKLAQSTDVHYRSFTGDGDSSRLYSLDPTQGALPCRMVLQV
uniref:Uncharacterized protein n=1 Tax=Tetranychus urticae TaxID=32264 RepID=T1K727_TETUR